MAFILDSTEIRAPYAIKESNDTQVAQNRSLSGAITRDYFGSNKRKWVLSYRNTQKAEYDIIKTIYTSYLTLGTGKTWAVTETNYTISSTTVHIDLVERSFNIRGSDYISDFDLILTEV